MASAVLRHVPYPGIWWTVTALALMYNAGQNYLLGRTNDNAVLHWDAGACYWKNVFFPLHPLLQPCCANKWGRIRSVDLQLYRALLLQPWQSFTSHECLSPYQDGHIWLLCGVRYCVSYSPQQGNEEPHTRGNERSLLSPTLAAWTVLGHHLKLSNR